MCYQAASEIINKHCTISPLVSSYLHCILVQPQKSKSKRGVILDFFKGIEQITILNS